MSQSTSDHDPATQPRRPEATLGELFGEMTQNVTTLLRKEIELAKLEAREEVSRWGAVPACSPVPASPRG